MHFVRNAFVIAGGTLADEAWTDCYPEGAICCLLIDMTITRDRVCHGSQCRSLHVESLKLSSQTPMSSKYQELTLQAL